MTDQSPRPSTGMFDPAPVGDDRIAITRMFPTPLASIRHPDHERLDAALGAAILARAAACSGVSHSNEGGWQSTDDFADWSGEAGAELIRFGLALAGQLSAILLPDKGLVEAELNWTYNAWANINRKGDSNAPHAHPASYWSGVYWVDDGREPDGAPVGGMLQFYDPRGAVPSFLSPFLRMKIEGCLSAGLTHEIRPESGTFVMFPSWLLHAVTPYRGTRPRLSVAFNFAA